MDEIKDFINKNRLLTVLTGFWLLISNFLYFSNRKSCDYLTEPSWLTLWNKLTFENFEMYQRASVHYFDQSGKFVVEQCVNLEYVMSGHFALMLIPIGIVSAICLSIKWVRSGPSTP